MHEILISAAIFVACLVMAVASQIISPTIADASGLSSNSQNDFSEIKPAKTVNGFLEIDPEDPNPALFVMATEKPISQATKLGNQMDKSNSIKTASGLTITDLVIGKGEEASPGQKVSVNYTGRLSNGKEFDTSYGRGPFSFPLGAGQVIKGWDEGVAGMKVGGKRELLIPPELGYGSRGAGGVIPPNATLTFEVELLSVD